MNKPLLESLKLEKISQQPGMPVLSVRFSVMSPVFEQWIPLSIRVTNPINVNDIEWLGVVQQLVDFQFDYSEAIVIKNNLRKLIIETLASN